eukprot:g1135.t1
MARAVFEAKRGDGPTASTWAVYIQEKSANMITAKQLEKVMQKVEKTDPEQPADALASAFAEAVDLHGGHLCGAINEATSKVESRHLPQPTSQLMHQRRPLDEGGAKQSQRARREAVAANYDNPHENDPKAQENGKS